MNIVLIGMRGAGKTAVGARLAEKMGRRFVDMDRLICQRTGLDIPQMVEKYGWERFRDMEEAVAVETAGLRDVVNAAGGGVVTREKTIWELKKSSIIVWLVAEAETLLARMGENSRRPLLVAGRTWREDVTVALAERQVLYQQAADYVVATDNRSVEEVADVILGLIEGEGEK